MPNMKEIKDRIAGIKETQKITNAMYLISSTKLQKARRDLNQTEPYFDALRKEIKRIFRSAEQIESRYLYTSDSDEKDYGTYGALVITADKGLAGSYNLNVLKEAMELKEQHEDTKFYVVGEYGRVFFAHRSIPIEKSFLYTAQNPTMRRAREISALLLDLFEAEKLDKIFVVYTDMKNAMNSEAICTRILPFYRSHFVQENEEKNGKKDLFEFYPSVNQVLKNALFGYISGFIYSALISSFCAEQQARMTAMNSANENADALLSTLSVQYNRVRQALITQEITEVTAGAKAQRLKREKELT